MIRGFVSGVFWGGVVAAFGLVVASQVAVPPGQTRPVVSVGSEAGPAANLPAAPALTDAPPAASAEPPAPAAALASAPAPVQPSPPGPEAESSLPAPGAAGETPPEAAADPAVEPAAPVPEAASPPPEASATAAEGPTTAEPAAPLAEPAAPADDLSPPPGSEFARPLPEVDPVLPAPEADVASAPVPDVAQPSSPAQPVPDTTSAAQPAPVAPPAEPPPPAAQAEAPSLPGAEAAATAPADPARPDAPAAEAVPGSADLPPPPPLTPEEEARLAPPAEDAPAAAPPQPGLGGTADGVTTGRLPRIGDAVPEAVTEAPVLSPADDTRPPVQRYARPFANPAAKPLFAVLLRDTGGPDIDRTALAALPFPVSFVIDPMAPDAATAAAIYRAAGQEVLMLASGIPAGATAADLEVTFANHATALPEAVALVDQASGGFQDDAPLAGEVTTLVKAQGRGLITYERGLNPADQVARREGLPAATLFRELDAEAESSPAIRRYLDRAAFKAAQEGRVAVIGTTRPETIAALLEWSVEGRASSVALAPATAVLAVQ